MARCDECKANKVCDHNKFGFENCDNFIAEDVVPKSKYEMAVKEREANVKGFTEELAKARNSAAKEILSELKKAVHEKAVQPGIIDVKPYILLKEFDAILTNMSKAIFEEGKRYED